jgi:signal transduction histidine kinase
MNRRPSTRVTIGVVGIVGIVWGLASEAVYYRSGAPAVDVVRDLAIGWTYLFGGLAIWSSRPANRTGRLMTLVGLTWFIGNLQLSTVSPVHEIGSAFADVVFVCLIALILAYPSGRLETRLDRLTVVILAIGTTANNAVRLLPSASEVDLETGRLYVGLALAIFAYAVVIRRWVVAPARRRSELLPVLVAGVVLMAVLSINLAIQAFDVPADLQALILAVRGLAPAAIPLALLVGFYRQSELRQRALLAAMPDVMIRLTRDGNVLDLRAHDSALVDSRSARRLGGRIGDVLPVGVVEPILATAHAVIDSGTIRTVDFSVDLPSGRREFEARITPSGADEVTAIVRDFTTQKAAEEEQRAAQEELRQSRARIIDAADAERRRLERDLHDGAQQRLVSLSLALRLVRTNVGPGADPSAVADLDAASAELKAALAELRDLARGIHPAILTEAGLGPAIESLAARSTVPTAVVALPDRRLSPAVESTAYFVVSEALTNAAKYATATSATVTAECPGTLLRVEVADDGVGGADPGAGGGLRGLADRVAALGGRLSISSPVDGGTRVVAEIPIGS